MWISVLGLILANLVFDCVGMQAVFYKPACTRDEILQKALIACASYKRGTEDQQPQQQYPGMVRTHRTDPEPVYYPDDPYTSAIESDIVGLAPQKPPPPQQRPLYHPLVQPPPYYPQPQPQRRQGQRSFIRPGRSGGYNNNNQMAPSSNYAHSVDSVPFYFDDEYVELGPELRRYLRSPVKIRDLNQIYTECCKGNCSPALFKDHCNYHYWNDYNL